MSKLFDVETTVHQLRRYHNIRAGSPGSAESAVNTMVEDDPKGLDDDVEFDVLETYSEDTTAYLSDEEQDD